MPAGSTPSASPLPSTVVLLKNMVGPGEVDTTLEAETAEECARFGRVERCTVYEVRQRATQMLCVRACVKGLGVAAER